MVMNVMTRLFMKYNYEINKRSLVCVRVPAVPDFILRTVAAAIVDKFVT